VTHEAELEDMVPILWRNSLVLALHATACVAGFIAGSSLVLVGIFALLGTFESLAYPSAMAMIVDAGRHLGMGSTMGLLQMSLAGGMIGGSVVGGGVESTFGVETVFQYAALMSLMGVTAFVFIATRGRRVPVPVPQTPAASSKRD
jgi:MFS family permease